MVLDDGFRFLFGLAFKCAEVPGVKTLGDMDRCFGLLVDDLSGFHSAWEIGGDDEMESAMSCDMVSEHMSLVAAFGVEADRRGAGDNLRLCHYSVLLCTNPET